MHLASMIIFFPIESLTRLDPAYELNNLYGWLETSHGLMVSEENCSDYLNW
jgi:hypothetical protein